MYMAVIFAVFLVKTPLFFFQAFRFFKELVLFLNQSISTKCRQLNLSNMNILLQNISAIKWGISDVKSPYDNNLTIFPSTGKGKKGWVVFLDWSWLASTISFFIYRNTHSSPLMHRNINRIGERKEKWGKDRKISGSEGSTEYSTAMISSLSNAVRHDHYLQVFRYSYY